MAKKINVNPNDFEPIVVNGCLVEANSIYEVVPKQPSDKSPEVYTELNSVKERFPGVSNSASLTQSDTGFFDGSPIFNTIHGVKNNWVKRKELADKYFEVFALPMRNYISEIERIRIPTDSEFFDKNYTHGYLSVTVGEGVQFDTSNPIDRFKLYIALTEGMLSMKGKRTEEEKEEGLKDENDLFHQDAQFAYVSLTNRKSKKEVLAEIEMETAYEFGNLLRTDFEMLKGLLNYINIPVKADTSKAELNTLYKTKVEADPKKFSEFVEILQEYKTAPKKLSAEIDMLAKLKSKKGRELIKKDGSSYYFNDTILGSNLKSVVATLLKEGNEDVLKEFYLNFD